MKRTLEDAYARIEVLAHAIAKDGERFTDRFALITTYEGDQKAADDRFKRVVARFENQPYEDWVGHHGPC
ncbi:hypothetical protein AB7M56_000275 [Bradyrhizobium elkanii]|jgi:hypothetical protein|nr:hypothetical protein [Bradyrhizobium elkanii]